MEEDKKGSGFVVKDKRLFAESGEARSAEEQTTPAAEEPKPSPEVRHNPVREKSLIIRQLILLILSCH